VDLQAEAQLIENKPDRSTSPDKRRTSARAANPRHPHMPMSGIILFLR
jgi:hypothetical protein